MVRLGCKDGKNAMNLDAKLTKYGEAATIGKRALNPTAKIHLKVANC